MNSLKLPFYLACCIILTSCSRQGTAHDNAVKYHAPRMYCTEISYYNNGSPEIHKYCTLQPEGTILTLADELSNEVGTHTVNYTLSDGEHNNFTTGTLQYEVLKYIPACMANATYDKTSERCECNDGYVNIHGSCELKVTCSSGYKYNDSTNTCEIQPVINPGNGQSGGNSSHGSEYFMFTSGYDIDTAYNTCVIRGKQYSSYSCVPLKNDEGLYTGYRLDY